ncbi:RING finger protein 212B [Phalacrocorax carbo]|uniref:RING finger protein 212B n=1 Tax=Phalacrocorax carbo TaxID=9209 RepID=UPI00311A6A52
MAPASPSPAAGTCCAPPAGPRVRAPSAPPSAATSPCPTRRVVSPLPTRHLEPSSPSSPSPQMRPQEKLFFKSPADIALKHLAHISQVWRFQRAQSDLLLASHRERARRAQAALDDARRLLQARERELEALRRENRELRRAQISPGWRGSSRSSTPRPVGITSPAQTVTPQPRRQLSGQVVSRSTPLEPSPAHGTPVWQVGGSHWGSATPPASSAAERPRNRLLFTQVLPAALPSPAHSAPSPAPLGQFYPYPSPSL